MKAVKFVRSVGQKMGWRPVLKRAMQSIRNANLNSSIDLDYGEGAITFCWHDDAGLNRSLTIDADCFCQREMPARSGNGFSVVTIDRERVRLRFTSELADKLELGQEVEFIGNFELNALSDLQELAALLKG